MNWKNSKEGFLETFPVRLKKSLTDNDPTNLASFPAMAKNKVMSSQFEVSSTVSTGQTIKAAERKNLILTVVMITQKL